MMRLAALIGFLALMAAGESSAQQWNDARTRTLVDRATVRRTQQLADTGLVDYRANATGYLTFLAQLGEGFVEPPKVVKTDQLALEVYWRAPSLSKQRIIGRRDTLLLPTDINYHRDHLGIVQNNFPNVIRLGDGDEVRDVPHPFSPSGLAVYDYAIGDSLRIGLPGRTIDVLEVKVRPKNDRTAAVVGAVYIDPSEAQVVRMALSFTRAALIDRQLEDVSIVLENGLQETRFWLPRRQEIEIRRTGSWLDYPARGIIRGRWEICCYAINQTIPLAVFGGPEIVQATPAELQQYPWRGSVLDSLPDDVRAVTDADVRRVQEEARVLVRKEALQRSRSSSLAVRGISDFVSVNRAEGIAIGTGFRRRLGAGLSLGLYGRYGLDDHLGKGRASIEWQRATGTALRLTVFRENRDARDEPEASVVRNSIAAQEFGTDLTQPFAARGVALTALIGSHLGVMWEVGASWERQGGVEVRATPSTGGYEPTILARSLHGPRVRIGAQRPTAAGPFGFDLRARFEVRGGWSEGLSPADSAPGDRWSGFARGFAGINAERTTTSGRLVLATTLAGTSGGDVAPQDLIYLGGSVSAPGYGAHRLAAQVAATQRIEWQRTTRAPSLSLGRFGSTGRSVTLAPYVHTAYIVSPERFAVHAPMPGGWYPAIGLGMLTVFDLLRFDIARGFRDGRWTFGVDLTRDFWRIL
jgi:hypothetical protein